MKTSNGYNFSVKKNICTLEIPATKGCYSHCVQLAKNEIINSDDLPYFTEILIKKNKQL